jgi:hypothetical protein
MKVWQREILLTTIAAFCIVLAIFCFIQGFKKRERYNKILGKSDSAEGKGKRLSIGFGLFLLYLAYKVMVDFIFGHGSA